MGCSKFLRCHWRRNDISQFHFTTFLFLNYNDKPYVFLIVAISYSFDLSLEYINIENKEPVDDEWMLPAN